MNTSLETMYQEEQKQGGMRMKTHKEIITIVTRTGPLQIKATVCDGKGLAIHPLVLYDGTLSKEEYIVTHIASGYALGMPIRGPLRARRYVNTVMDAVDWNQSREELQKHRDIPTLLREKREELGL